MPERITRILTILRSLNEGSGNGVKHLASRLGISSRTVHRDIATLRSVGIQIEFDRPGKCYRVDQKVVPQLPGSEDLAELLLQASTTVLPRSKRRKAMAQRAALVLSTHLPAKLCGANRFLSNSIQMVPGNYSDKISSVFSAVGEAISSKRCVRLQIYCEKSNLDGTWEVQPQRLVFTGNQWLLEGIFFIDHQNFRVALENVAAVEMSDEPFAKKITKKKWCWNKPDVELC